MSKIILLVEDNPDDEELTILAFKESGNINEIVVARDGEEALDYLFGTRAYTGRDLTVMPTLVLLDLKLPKIDGLGVLRAMRGNNLTRRIPVVVLTSSMEQDDIVRSYDLGANSYVRKPVEFTQFLTAANYLGLYWMVLNESAK